MEDAIAFVGPLVLWVVIGWVLLHFFGSGGGGFGDDFDTKDPGC